jgi:hypothetical protein
MAPTLRLGGLLVIALVAMACAPGLVDAKAVKNPIPGIPKSLPNESVCGGFSPETTFCSTGQHVNEQFIITGGLGAAPIGRQRHNVIGAGFIGVLESRLVHEEGARVLSCEYFDGNPANRFCTGSGTFPHNGQAYTHDCYAFPAAGSSDAAWACELTTYENEELPPIPPVSPGEILDLVEIPEIRYTNAA